VRNPCKTWASDLVLVSLCHCNEQTPQKGPRKDPAAVSLGRRGGLKGGKARAKSLSAKRRSQIATAAAKAAELEAAQKGQTPDLPVTGRCAA